MKKTAQPPSVDAPPISRPGYDIVGLQPADRMPISFAGRSFDLANLSAEDAAFLLGFPQQVPYLRQTTDVSEASV